MRDAARGNGRRPTNRKDGRIMPTTETLPPEVFTSSDGTTVRIREDGALVVNDLWALPPKEVEPVREFFRHEEDERLGRWRWPENPECVVYHRVNVNGDHKVINLADGTGMLWGRDMEPAPQSSDPLESAARAYFDAHPEPKPWHDAKPGEVWLLARDGTPELNEAGEKKGKLVFWPITGKPGYTPEFAPEIFATGRRIWPEVQS